MSKLLQENITIKITLTFYIFQIGDNIATPTTEDSSPNNPLLLFSSLFTDNFDYLACRWLRIMPKEIDFSNIIIPFDTEEDLVETFNNKTSGMTMIAGDYDTNQHVCAQISKKNYILNLVFYNFRYRLYHSTDSDETSHKWKHQKVV